MEATTEVRWWWPGSPPAAVGDWFAALPGAADDERRVDHYLVTANDRDTGIKMRARKRLDVKTLVAREAAETITDGVVGKVERWAKWSFLLADGALDETDLDGPDSAWVAARKHRWLLDVEGSEVELASVSAGGRRWWTFAIEVAGHDVAAREALVAVVRWLLAADPPAELELAADRSHGYAAQLVDLRLR